jgi:hypothetical protein
MHTIAIKSVHFADTVDFHNERRKSERRFGRRRVRREQNKMAENEKKGLKSFLSAAAQDNDIRSVLVPGTETPYATAVMLTAGIENLQGLVDAFDEWINRTRGLMIGWKDECEYRGLYTAATDTTKAAGGSESGSEVFAGLDNDTLLFEVSSESGNARSRISHLSEPSFRDDLASLLGMVRTIDIEAFNESRELEPLLDKVRELSASELHNKNEVLETLGSYSPENQSTLLVEGIRKLRSDSSKGSRSGDMADEESL